VGSLVVALFDTVRGLLKDVNDTRWIAQQQDTDLFKLRSSLESLLKQLDLLQQKRLNSVILQQQVQQLQEEVRTRLSQLPQPAARSWLQKLFAWPSIFCQACIGPFDLTRNIEKATEELSKYALPGDSFDICQRCINIPLPPLPVRPEAAANILLDKLAAFAVQQPQQQQQQQQQQQPPVFQLLGMAGMGKSTLALMVAKELEQQGEHTGVVNAKCNSMQKRHAYVQSFSLQLFIHTILWEKNS
jgi:hypothetical protein